MVTGCSERAVGFGKRSAGTLGRISTRSFFGNAAYTASAVMSGQPRVDRRGRTGDKAILTTTSSHVFVADHRLARSSESSVPPELEAALRQATPMLNFEWWTNPLNAPAELRGDVRQETLGWQATAAAARAFAHLAEPLVHDCRPRIHPNRKPPTRRRRRPGRTQHLARHSPNFNLKFEGGPSAGPGSGPGAEVLDCSRDPPGWPPFAGQPPSVDRARDLLQELARVPEGLPSPQ
jgi:hypothetical protein